MKKILFVAHNGNMGGGAERSLLELLVFLKDNQPNLDLLVAAPFEGVFTEELKQHSIQFVILPMPYGALPAQYSEGEDEISTKEKLSIGFADAFLKAQQVIIKFKPDLIVSNTIVIPWFTKAAKIYNVPAVTFVRELFDARNGVRELIPSTDKYIRQLMTNSSHLFYNSKYTVETYKKFNNNNPFSILYPSATVPQKYLQKSKEASLIPFSSQKNRIIILGNVTEHKNQLDVIKAMGHLKKSATFKNTSLTIMGNTNNKDYLSSLKTCIEKNELSSVVRFEPFSVNPYPKLIEHDIVIMASSHEAFGRVTLEGQLLGRLVIGANSGGTKEIIEHKKTGLLYKDGDSKDLAKKIEWAIQNKEASKEIARSSQKQSIKKFKIDSTIKPFLAYVNKIKQHTYPPEEDLIGYDEYNCSNRNTHLEERLQEYAKALEDAIGRISKLEKEIPLRKKATGQIKKLLAKISK